MNRAELAASAATEVDRVEAELVAELLRVFDRQERVVLARLQGPKARKHTRHWDPPGERKVDPKFVVDPGRWALDAAGATAPIIRRTMTSVYGRVSKRVADRVAGRVPPAAAAVAAKLEAAVKERLDSVAIGIETAIKEVQDFLDREEEAGAAMPDIVTGVSQLYAGRSQTWADRIAATSAVGAINVASYMAAQDMGCPSKRWLSRRDDNVRDTHEHADGQTVGLREPFVLGGIASQPRKVKLLIPGVPMPGVPLDEVMNCRCTMLFALPAETKGDVGPLEVKDGDSHTPPDAVQAAAKRGLELRRAHNGRGGTEVGVARARDLASGGGVSGDTVRRMASYFARHEVDKSGTGWGSSSNPSAGYIAWLLWGGDAGAAWARKVTRSLDGEKADAAVLEVKDLDHEPPSAPGGPGGGHPGSAGLPSVPALIAARTPGDAGSLQALGVVLARVADPGDDAGAWRDVLAARDDGDLSVAEYDYLAAAVGATTREVLS